MAMDGEWAVVGASSRSVEVATASNNSSYGGITIYRKVAGSWSKYKDIYSPAVHTTSFGLSVSISGDNIAVEYFFNYHNAK